MENKRKQTIYKTVMLIIVVAIVTFVITSIMNYDGPIKYMVSSNNDTDITAKIENAIETIEELLEEKYLGDIEEDALVEGALKGMVDAVGDVYTEYYTAEELEEFTSSTLGDYVGIGVYLTVDYENDAAVIIAPISGSSAEEAGLQSGDLILEADGVKYTASELTELTTYIRGEEGTSVELTISRNGEIFNVTVTRKSVDIKYVVSEMLEDNIGYIAISTFDKDCGKDFLNEYNNLKEQGMTSLIIDVRSNGGGLVDQALEIADLICNKGETTLVTVDKNGDEEIATSKTDATINIPIILLIDENSASASEILAAALKDNDKATLVGMTTYGKGVIQELIYLSNGGALKVTTSEYYTPNKEKIDGVGIKPDYEISEVEEQLEKAIELLTSENS